MSGETASVVEVCAVAAAGVTAVAAAGAAGALVAARVVASAPGAGLSAVGQRLEQRYARHRERQAALAAWESAAREVVDRNARLSVLLTRPGGTPPGLPEPLILQDQSLDQLMAWCAATDQALDRVERSLQAEAAAAVSAVLDAVTGNGTGASAAGGLLAAHQAAHQAASTAPPPELVEACSRVLRGLSTDVSATDRAGVLAAVARVRECTTPAARQGWLAELRIRVRKINGVAAQRREQARTAATMVAALATATDPDVVALRVELDSVVARRRPLDPELRKRALAACEQARTEQENSYVRGSLTTALENLGYRVDQGFDTFTGQGARLRLVRNQWPEHAVSVVVGDGEVRTMVVRTESGEGDDAQRLDTEREQQWCTDFEELRDQLAGNGLRLDVQRLVPPGERHVPVAARTRKPGRHQQHQHSQSNRERGR